MENNISRKSLLKKFFLFNQSLLIINKCLKSLSETVRTVYINIFNKVGQNIIFIFFISMWVQVPQWDNDWSKCAIDIPDSSCHWYIKSPDNTYGEGFDWSNAPWFDVNGLNDIAQTERETVVEKLQKQ